MPETVAPVEPLVEAEPEPEIDLSAVPDREHLGALFVDEDLFDFDDDEEDDEDSEEDAALAVTGLLIRALLLGHEQDDSGWLHSSAVKQQMRRMDPSFNEKALGFRSFSDFLKSRANVAELEETGHERLVRLREQGE